MRTGEKEEEGGDNQAGKKKRFILDFRMSISRKLFFKERKSRNESIFFIK
jgi:hypothetical protein